VSNVLIVVQVVIVFLLILLVLIQKSSDEGVANLADRYSSSTKRRVTGGLVEKITVVVAACFMLNSLVMAKVNSLSLRRYDRVMELVTHDGIDDIDGTGVGQFEKDKNGDGSNMISKIVEKAGKSSDHAVSH